MKTMKEYIVTGLTMVLLFVITNLVANIPVDSNTKASSSFTAQVIHDSEVLLTWQSDKDNVSLESYTLEKSLDGQHFEAVSHQRFPRSITSHIHTDFFNGLETYYRLSGQTRDGRTIILGLIRINEKGVNHLVTDLESRSLKFIDTLYYQ